MNDKWDLRFLQSADHVSTWSKDTRKQVGCVIVDSDYNQLSGGFNGFPRGISDDGRLDEKSTKLKMIVHAEANAVATAARNGHSLKGSTAYITHPPCSQCAALMIQAGVDRVVFFSGDKNSSWREDWELSMSMLREAGKGVREFPR